MSSGFTGLQKNLCLSKISLRKKTMVAYISAPYMQDKLSYRIYSPISRSAYKLVVIFEVILVGFAIDPLISRYNFLPKSETILNTVNVLHLAVYSF